MRRQWTETPRCQLAAAGGARARSPPDEPRDRAGDAVAAGQARGNV